MPIENKLPLKEHLSQKYRNPLVSQLLLKLRDNAKYLTDKPDIKTFFIKTKLVASRYIIGFQVNPRYFSKKVQSFT